MLTLNNIKLVLIFVDEKRGYKNLIFFYLYRSSDIFDFLQFDWLHQRAAFCDIQAAGRSCHKYIYNRICYKTYPCTAFLDNSQNKYSL